MWTAPFHPIHRPWPPKLTTAAVAAATKPPTRCLPLTISALVSPNTTNQGQDSTQNYGNLGKAVLTAAVKSNPQQQSSKPKQKQKLENQQGQNQEDLSGADVLWALQKAAIRKAEKTKRDVKMKNRNSKNGGAQIGDEDRIDYSDVRALCIKDEWSSRIIELEKKLEELLIDG